MTRYLYSQTPFSLLRQNDWEYGVMLLSRCISNQILDVAVSILQHHDARQIPLDHKKMVFRPIYALTQIPSAFPSTATTEFTLSHCWKLFVYNILSLEDLNDKTIEIVFQDPNVVRPKIMTHTLPGLGRILGKFRVIIQTLIVKKFEVIEKIYDEKKDHYLVLEILKYLCKRIPAMSQEDLAQSSTYDAMLQAAKNGITELIELMGAVNPDLLLVADESKRGIFAHAIVNRHGKVFQLIHTVKSKEITTTFEDKLKNTLLHIAAVLGPSSYFDHISNAVLQMQRELQWFQDVMEVMPKYLHEAKDANGKTAKEVFNDDHKELLKSGQQWVKETAASFTLVGTIIITIMFAAAFTLPGGNDINDGTRTLLPKNKTVFTFFIISDTISLVTSSSSVLMFIGILTSRYAEEDFDSSLPLKLLFGLFTLFLSVVSMMCAFCAALALVLKGFIGIVIAAIGLALIPVLVLVLSLVRIAWEITQSTFRFDKFSAKKKKN